MLYEVIMFDLDSSDDEAEVRALGSLRRRDTRHVGRLGGEKRSDVPTPDFVFVKPELGTHEAHA